jgi:hypothetical protein
MVDLNVVHGIDLAGKLVVQVCVVIIRYLCIQKWIILNLQPVAH